MRIGMGAVQLSTIRNGLLQYGTIPIPRYIRISVRGFENIPINFPLGVPTIVGLLNFGTVKVGDKIFIIAHGAFQNLGVGNTSAEARLLQNSGTAVLDYDGGPATELYVFEPFMTAPDFWAFQIGGIIDVTGEGTLVMRYEGHAISQAMTGTLPYWHWQAVVLKMLD